MCGEGFCGLEGCGGGVAEEEGGGREEAGGFEEEAIVGGVGGCDGDAEVVGDVEFFGGPDVLWAAGVDVGAALDVVERGEDEMVFGDGGLLRELLRGGGEDDGGLEVDGIFSDGFEVKRDDGALREGGGEAFGLPVFVELEDDLAVEQAVDVGLAGDGDFPGAFGSVESDFAMEEVDAAVEEDGGVALAVVESLGASADVGGLAAEDFFGVDRAVCRASRV